MSTKPAAAHPQLFTQSVANEVTRVRRQVALHLRLDCRRHRSGELSNRRTCPLGERLGDQLCVAERGRIQVAAHSLGTNTLLAANRSAASIQSASRLQATGTLLGGAAQAGGLYYGAKK